MEKIPKAGLKTIVAAALGLIPGGRYVEDLTIEMAEKVIDTLTKDDRDIVEHITNDIFSLLVKNSEKISPEDPGRAISAGYNIIDTIKKSGLDANVIIDCCLDADLVNEYLQSFPATGIEFASGGRRKIYDAYLKEFSETLIIAVFPTVPFQRRLFQRLLTNQKKSINEKN